MSEQPKVQTPPAPVKAEPKKATMFQSVGLAGGAAVITVSFIHPIDVMKTRLQIQGEAGRSTKQYSGLMDVFKHVKSEGGYLAFYKGIQAAWLRESVYTSLRIGMYEEVRNYISGGKKSTIWQNFVAGGITGAVGSTAGNPFDVLKTRMMANEKAGKVSMKETASEIMSGQGAAGFYKGLSANINRAIVLNATKMGCYNTIKDKLVQGGYFGKGLGLQFVAAFCSGFFMAITVCPFDMVRTRLMNQPHDAKIYNGMIHCFSKIASSEGPKALYKGFIPVWGRFAPTTTLQLVIFEQLKQAMGLGTL